MKDRRILGVDKRIPSEAVTDQDPWNHGDQEVVDKNDLARRSYLEDKVYEKPISKDLKPWLQ